MHTLNIRRVDTCHFPFKIRNVKYAQTDMNLYTAIKLETKRPLEKKPSFICYFTDFTDVKKTCNLTKMYCFVFVLFLQIFLIISRIVKQTYKKN